MAEGPLPFTEMSCRIWLRFFHSRCWVPTLFCEYITMYLSITLLLDIWLPSVATTMNIFQLSCKSWAPDSFLLLLDSVSSVPKCLHPMGSFCNSGSKNVSPFPGPLHSVKHTCSDSSDVTLSFWHEWPGLWVFRSLLTSEIAAPSFPGWGKSHQSLWRVTNVWLIFPNSFFLASCLFRSFVAGSGTQLPRNVFIKTLFYKIMAFVLVLLAVIALFFCIEGTTFSLIFLLLRMNWVFFQDLCLLQFFFWWLWVLAYTPHYFFEFFKKFFFSLNSGTS